MIEKERIQDAVVCKKDCTILEVSRILRDTRNRHLIVIDDALHPLGIISTVDINNRIVSEEKDPKKTKAIDIMTKPIDIVEISETYETAYQKMINKSTYSIPVVNKGKLVGLLSFNQLFLKVKEAKK